MHPRLKAIFYLFFCSRERDPLSEMNNSEVIATKSSESSPGGKVKSEPPKETGNESTATTVTHDWMPLVAHLAKALVE